MQVGLVGTGNIAAAIAQGLGEPVICFDINTAKAEAFAKRFDGSRVAASIAELADGSDVIFLCHKPQQLDEVAAEIKDYDGVIVSPLAGVTVQQLKQHYGSCGLIRIMPNTAVATGAGTVSVATNRVDSPDNSKVRELLDRLGTVVELDESIFDAGMAVSGVGPAYIALIAEAWSDAAVRNGLTPLQAQQLVISTLEGTVKLLKSSESDGWIDLAAARRAVTSPGGVTAKGLRELERQGIREAFNAATDAVIGKVE